VTSKVVKKLSRYDAVIIDDIGYVQHSRQQMEVLFHSWPMVTNAAA
jgi:DNA replication protein DnaC